MLLRTALRQIEGVAHDPIAAPPGEDVLLHTHLKVSALVHAPADIGVFTLVVLTHHIHVDVAGLIAVHRRRDAGQ